MTHMGTAACACSKQLKIEDTCICLAVTIPKLRGACADPGFRILWSDEFAGTSVDTASWTFENGDGSQYGIPGLSSSLRRLASFLEHKCASTFPP